MNISVIIPTFNRPQQLLQAIESVYHQTHKASEIIVVDDGSHTPLTNAIIKEYNLTYIYQENQGVAVARNRGINEAQHPWLAFLDSDDVWEKNKLLRHVQLHQEQKEFKASFTNELWNRNGKIIVPKKHQQKEQPTFLNSLRECKIGASTFFCQKEFLQTVGCFDDGLKVCEDYDLWLRILQYESIYYIDEQLTTKHAGHENQLSFTTPLIDTYRIQALEKHLESPYKKEVIEELEHKINILLKGARKFDNQKIVSYYEAKLQRILLLLQ